MKITKRLHSSVFMLTLTALSYGGSLYAQTQNAQALTVSKPCTKPIDPSVEDWCTEKAGYDAEAADLKNKFDAVTKRMKQLGAPASLRALWR